jgi:hypothetical protein
MLTTTKQEAPPLVGGVVHGGAILMTHEQSEIRVTDAPQGFEEAFAETHPKMSEYWGCMGTFTEKGDSTPAYLNLFYSREDAEAHACVPSEFWVWDRRPARKTSLKATLSAARRDGELGVQVRAFVGGSWQVVHTYLSCEPLPEDLR